jgi:predicted nucleic acid-binding protein
VRKFILDSNCFIAASRGLDKGAFERFVQAAAPGLYLSTVVAAELRAGASGRREVRLLENAVLRPYYKRGRVANPSTSAWEALGKTLARLAKEEGVPLRSIPKSFVFDILIAYSCRELGAILISSNQRDMQRIQQVFSFQLIPPYPDLS